MTEHNHLDDDHIVGELAAAMVASEEEQLPAALAARITAAGKLAVGRDRTPVVDLASRRRMPVLLWSGWAAAAAVLLWAVAGSDRDDGPGTLVSPTTLRASLSVATSPVAWDRADDPTSRIAEGDIVWSDSAQTGVMRFRGLTVNDPAKEQYQLWIFDAARDERYPVDGGVFDIASDSGDVLVRIHPRVPVNRATLFVVTVERPGGVVVSDRARVVVLAKRPAAT